MSFLWFIRAYTIGKLLLLLHVFVSKLFLGFGTKARADKRDLTTSIKNVIKDDVINFQSRVLPSDLIKPKSN